MSKTTGLLIAILGLGLFLRTWNLTQPDVLIFDESHYQPAAAYIAGKIDWPGIGVWKDDPVATKSKDPNFYHPPFGKVIISIGISIFGNKPLGWRIMSVIFGMGSLLLFYFAARDLWRRQDLALAALFLLAIDFLHIVQSRIAMLDVFAFFFSQLAFWGLIRVRETPRSWIWNSVAVIGLGLGLCVKYPSVTVCLAFAIGYLLPSSSLPSIKNRFAFLCGIGAATLGIVLLSSIWSISRGLSFWGWAELQLFSFQKLTGKFPPHQYGSYPPAWLFNSRAIWYYFKDTGPTGYASILGMGNPVVWLSFLPASYVFARLKDFKTPDAIVAIWFAANYLPHFLALWERQGFIYYMLLALGAMVLLVTRVLFAIAPRREWRWAYWGLAAAILLAFLPMLAAQPIPLPYYGAIVRWVSP